MRRPIQAARATASSRTQAVTGEGDPLPADGVSTAPVQQAATDASVSTASTAAGVNHAGATSWPRTMMYTQLELFPRRTGGTYHRAQSASTT